MFPAMECQPSTSSSLEWSQPCRQFEYSEILLATEDFSGSFVIGQGGFGKVYKGLIVSGSSAAFVAIKRLDSMSTQGATEFWAEVEMLSKLRHCHLVSLIGYCNFEKEMILIYELMPNGSLADHLHKLGAPLSWLWRLRICIGAARGLDYLHNGLGSDFVIHRDVKTSNILLHESGVAKISDFGLSKIHPSNQPSTYINTLVKGTFGYLDPSYFYTGRLTRKSDVYAFGVVLLEVLCRKKAVDESLDEGLAPWAQDSIRKGNLNHIIDYGIRGQISSKCLKEFIRIADLCLHNNPQQRPTMAEVVASLESILLLQEKMNSSLQPPWRTVLGRMADRFPFISNGENSVYSDLIGSDYKDFTTRISSLKEYRFADLKRATRDFSQDLRLGKGSSGEVFLGWVDRNTFAPSTDGVGIAVAVKMYSQGHPEWKTVATVLGWLTHPNILSLLGYCDDKKHKRTLLVYEYMPNHNLGYFLFGDAPEVVEPLSWGTQLMIMVGVARGLAYMHSLSDQVLHRHIKPSNILLDQDFNAKIGDFGLAKFGLEIRKLNGITTNVVGTLGYIDPRYLSSGHVSVKTDIYSFGVVLLQILTGKMAIDMEGAYILDGLVDEESSFLVDPASPFLVDWANPFLEDRSELKKIMDPRLQQNYPIEGAFECAALALRCVAKDHKNRPSSEEVLWTLEQIYDVNK